MLRNAWVAIRLAYYQFRFKLAMEKYRRMLATGQYAASREAVDCAKSWADKYAALTLAAMV